MSSHANWRRAISHSVPTTKIKQATTEDQGYNSEGLLNDVHEISTVIIYLNSEAAFGFVTLSPCISSYNVRSGYIFLAGTCLVSLASL